MSVLQRCPCYRESNKGSEERQGPTLDVRFTQSEWLYTYTAISRKVVGKSARDNPERYCGWFWVHCCSKKFERMVREATHSCLQVLKESNKSRFDGYCVRSSVFITSNVTFRDCRVHNFSDNLSRNSCIYFTQFSMIPAIFWTLITTVKELL